MLFIIRSLIIIQFSHVLTSLTVAGVCICFLSQVEGGRKNQYFHLLSPHATHHVHQEARGGVYVRMCASSTKLSIMKVVG